MDLCGTDVGHYSGKLSHSVEKSPLNKIHSNFEPYGH